MVAAQDNVLRFHYLSTKNGLPRNTTYSIVEDKYGFIWITTIDGLCRYDGYSVKVYNYDSRNPKSLLNNRPQTIFKDGKGDIWIGFAPHNPVCRYNYQTDDFSHFTLNSLPVQLKGMFAKYEQGNAFVENSEFRWERKDNYLVQYNKLTHQQVEYRYNQLDRYGLSDDYIVNLYLDSHDILWITTDAGGVCYADVNQPKFQLHTITQPINSIGNSLIRTICESSRGDLWIGTRKNGIMRIGSDNIITSFKHSNKDKTSLPDDRIRKIYKDKYGQMWFGTKGGLLRYIPEIDCFKIYPAISKRHNDNWIYAVEEDSQSNLWIGTWTGGIARYDRDKDRFIAYKLKDPRYAWNIRMLLKDTNSNLWIGMEGNGFSYFKREFRGGREIATFRNFRHNYLNNNSLIDDRVYSLCKDRFGYLWIGTGRGLNRFDPRTGCFLRFPENRFLANEPIIGILSDDKDNIWITHQYGLTRLNCKSFITSDYSCQDDLYNIEFSEDAYYRKSGTGECIIGGNLGYISFDPNIIKENRYAPRSIITDFYISGKSLTLNQKIDGRVILKQPLYLTKSITLKWEERNIELEYSVLHFSNPSNNSYAYRLIGYDNDWTNASANNRKASYKNLPSGKYTFEVKSASSYGVWSDSATQLEIIVLPPWWKTWWAYMIYLLLVVGLIRLAYSMILNREKLKHQIQIERLKLEKAKELEELKNKFFTNVSHELRTPLTLILDPIKKLVDQKEQFGQATNYFHELILENSKRLLLLVNQLLDLKKIESGAMTLNISTIDIVSKVRSLAGMFELKVNERHIKLEIVSDSNKIVSGVDEDKLDKIILNLLSNSIKFTPDYGIITVELYWTQGNDFFEIIIRDNGPGISADKVNKIFDPFYQIEGNSNSNGTGIGLALVKEFVELHNGSIRVESNIGIGTCFSLKFPLRVVDEVVAEKENNNVWDFQTDELGNIQNNKELPIVLVVEDNSDVSDYLKFLLSENYCVHVSSNGINGFNIATEIIPDLVLSDIMMPGISGVELVEKLKIDQRTSHIPVILLTARQTEELKVESFETGADDYITKPFNSNTLLARIKNLIDSRKKLRKLFDKGNGFDISDIAVNQIDKIFLDNLLKHIYDNIARVNFDLEELAGKLNMSRVQLNRKIKSMTDKTAQEFVLTVRLNKAVELLLSGQYNVTEVAELVGYSELPNFTRSFTKQFGESPKSFVLNHRK